MARQSDNAYDLRFGVICSLFYRDILGAKSVPKQIDLLDEFFPGLVIREIPADSEEAAEVAAVYDDQHQVIYAQRKEDGTFRLNTSGSPENRRITQILGRLMGTAKGSQEKERAAAKAMQKRMASDLCFNPEVLILYRNQIVTRIDHLTDEQYDRFIEKIADYINGVISRRASQAQEERDAEPFPIDEEIFSEAMHTIVYQWNLEGNEPEDDPDVTATTDLETTANAFTWLLLLSLLRNECGRLNQTYLSTFQPRSAYRPVSHVIEYTETDDPNLIGTEEEIYTGNDLDHRFPGIEWYCDRCGEYLNIQPGFDDHLHEWQCQKCGYINRITLDAIYDTDIAWQNGQASIDRDAFARALKERTDNADRKVPKPGNTDHPELSGADSVVSSAKENLQNDSTN